MGNRKKFIYLVQGKMSDLKHFEHLNRENSVLMSLSWDEAPKDKVNPRHYFLPESTWTEGRNFLLKKAIECTEEWEYIVFVDGDARGSSEGFLEFEEFLIEYKPALGLPLVDQIKKSGRFIPEALVQTQTSFDQVMQAYRRDVVLESICVPYSQDLDNESWWYACEINQYLTLKYYEGSILQFNRFEVFNSNHSNSENIENGSQYKGGVTKEGLKKCRKNIEGKFGRQSLLIGTLFHPWYLPRAHGHYGPAKLKIAIGEHNLRMIAKEILRIIVENSYNFVLQAIYRRRYPKQRLITRMEDFEL